jgi:flagellar protein FliO/FliZ
MERFLDVLPILGSFVMIILILFGAWYATRWYARRMGSAVLGKNIRVVDRAALGNASSLMIARVAGKYYLLGVSEHSVNLLRELPDFEEPAEGPGAAPSFQKLLERVLRGKAQAGQNDKDNGEPQ